MEFSDIVGMTFESVAVARRDRRGLYDRSYEDRITFTAVGGKAYVMFHSHDCTEDVRIEDIAGDLDDLVDTPILTAVEAVSEDTLPADAISQAEAVLMAMNPPNRGDESQTWTFYRVSTIKGSVVIRWYGTSNGYYSERVDFVESN